jgi:hypothetical protein
MPRQFGKFSGVIAMSKMIKAMFDSTDMAELAMMRIKRNGIDVESYELEPTSRPAADGAVNQLVFPYNAVYGFGPGALHSDIERVQPTGGVMYVSENDGTTGRRTIEDDIYSSEVQMNIKVPDNQADIAKVILRSCHGYNLQTL